MLMIWIKFVLEDEIYLDIKYKKLSCEKTVDESLLLNNKRRNCNMQ